MMKEADAISCMKSFCISLTRIRVDELTNVMVTPKMLKMSERKTAYANYETVPKKKKCLIRDVLERMSEIRNWGKSNQFMASPYSKIRAKPKMLPEMDEVTPRELADRRSLHTCLMCYKEFKSTMGLEIHNKIHFGVPKWYLCNHCPAAFDRRDRCAVHMKKHTPVRSYFCHVCSATFENRNESLKHDLEHLNVKKFRCRYCGAKFRTKIIYIRHERVHQLETLHICRICSKKEVSFAALIMHQQIHDKELMDRLPIVNVVLESATPLQPARESASFEIDDRISDEDISSEYADVNVYSVPKSLERYENGEGSSGEDISFLEYINAGIRSASKDLERFKSGGGILDEDINLEYADVDVRSAAEDSEHLKKDRTSEKDTSLEYADVGVCSAADNLEHFENGYRSGRDNVAACSIPENLEYSESKRRSDDVADDCSTPEDLKRVESGSSDENAVTTNVPTDLKIVQNGCSSNVVDADRNFTSKPVKPLKAGCRWSVVGFPIPKALKHVKNGYRWSDVGSCNRSASQDLEHVENVHHSNHGVSGKSARIRRRSEMNNNKPHKCIFC